MKINSRILFLLLLFVALPARAGQGWYLMTPPDFNAKNAKTPLSKWNQEKAFNKAEECEDYRMIQIEVENGVIKDNLELIKEAKRKNDKYTESMAEDNYRFSINNRDSWTATKCITSDDPRLKP